MPRSHIGVGIQKGAQLRHDCQKLRLIMCAKHMNSTQKRFHRYGISFRHFLIHNKLLALKVCYLFLRKCCVLSHLRDMGVTNHRGPCNLLEVFHKGFCHALQTERKTRALGVNVHGLAAAAAEYSRNLHV